MQHYDLIVIGGGPGGYVAAIRASQLGLRTALAERARVGGVCLNHGCIPTKTLYRSAEVLHTMRSAASFGLRAGEAEVELSSLRVRKDKVVDTLVSGVASLLKQNGVAVLDGQAAFSDERTLRVADKTYTADAYCIATGGRSAAPPIEGIGLDGVMDSSEALALSDLPERIVIIGGGVIGVEMAGIYRAFGAEVTVVEFLPGLLGTLDSELANFARKRLQAQGVRVCTGTKVTRIEGTRGALTVQAEGPDGPLTLPCTHVLCCTGRAPHTEGLCLDAAGVVCGKTGIPVDADYRTNVPHIYAIGDVTGRMMLAHVASEEGRVFAERLAGQSTRVDYSLVPNCVFAFPEMASVGMTEAQLKQTGVAYEAARFQFAGNGKALTLGETEGFVKLLAAKDMSALLGAHIAGPHASDLIHEIAVAMKAMLTVEEAARTMHAHPSLSEAVMECIQRLLGEAIHVPPKRKL